MDDSVLSNTPCPLKNQSFLLARLQHIHGPQLWWLVYNTIWSLPCFLWSVPIA